MPEDGRVYISRKKAVLSREQKTGLGMVVGFGVLTLVFGVFYLWKHVASPFVLSYDGPQFLTGNEERQKEMETLRKEDTDGDGLNDYDELYVYRTSPYIADSDSDGVDDKSEVMSGKDPNCAPNMPCGAARDTVNPATLQGTFVEEAAAAAEASALNGQLPEVVVPTAEDIAAVLAAMTSEEVRTLLIESGGDPAEINALTDEELRAALNVALQTIAQQEGSAAAASDEPLQQPTP